MLDVNKVREITNKIAELQKTEESIRFSKKYYEVRAMGIRNSHGETILVEIEDYPELESVVKLLLDYVYARSKEKQKELSAQLAEVIGNETV